VCNLRDVQRNCPRGAAELTNLGGSFHCRLDAPVALAAETLERNTSFGCLFSVTMHPFGFSAQGFAHFDHMDGFGQHKVSLLVDDRACPGLMPKTLAKAGVEYL
jgi:hypothetical protein